MPEETNREVDSISDDAMKMLLDYDWPGNIRELENVVERAVVTSKKRVLATDSFAYLNPGVCVGIPSTPRSLEEAEIAHIRQILDEKDWNISHAAKVLQVDRTTLHKKIRRYGLERSSL